MKKTYFSIALLLLSFSLIAQKLPFQGYLEESGRPVNGTKSFNFALLDYGWTETIENVSIDNGIYNVVLGQINLLPDTIFRNISETPLSIAIDGVSLGTVTLYKSLIGGQSSSTADGLVSVKDPNGKVKGELMYFPTNNAGSLVLYGANDSTNVIIGSSSPGYAGFIGLYDSLRNSGLQLRVTNKGRGNLFTNNENHKNVGWFGGAGNDGFTQLISYDETETFTGALLLGSFADGKYPEMYLEGSAQLNLGLGRFKVEQLPNGEETAFLELNRSNGGGQARLSISQNSEGTDPDGVAGSLALWGDTSPNFIFESASSIDHDLPNAALYGSIGNGTGWYYTALDFGADKTADGIQEYGFMNFQNNQSGSSVGTVAITGNYGETGAGGMEIRNNAGLNTIRFDGNSGGIYANNIFANIAPNDGAEFRVNYTGGTQFLTGNPADGRFTIYNATGGQAAGLSSEGLNGGFGRLKLFGNDNFRRYESGIDDGNLAYTEYYGSAPNNSLIGRIGGFGNDGLFQLLSYDDSNIKSGAILLGTLSNSRQPGLYIEGIRQPDFGLGRLEIVDLPDGQEAARFEIAKSNGGGRAELSINQDSGGVDPAGSNGYLNLWGDSSPNFIFSSSSSIDHDLPNAALLGSIEDGTGWYYTGLDYGVGKTTDGTQEFGFLNIQNSQLGSSYGTVGLTGNYGESGAGGIEVRDNLGTTTATLEGRGNGNSGQLALRGSTGLNLVTVQNRGGNSGQAIFYGPSGAVRSEIGSFGDDSGFLILYGPNGSKNVQLDRDPGNTNLGQLTLFGTDGSSSVFATASTDGTNQWGNLALRNNGVDMISLDANQGFITVGDPFGGSGVSIEALNGKVVVSNELKSMTANVGDWFSGTGIWLDGNTGDLSTTGSISTNGILNINDELGNPSIQISGNSTNPSLGHSKFAFGIGEFQNNALMHLKGDDNTGLNDLRVRLDVIPDGLGSSYGTIKMYAASFEETISLDGQAGTINASGAITQNSDKRLKENIIGLDNALNNTLKMRGVSYNWIDKNKSQKNQIGVIAQEVEEIYPEFVHTDDKGMKAVNYAQMTAVLIEAIKELNKKVVTLESEVGNLQKENTALTSALNETKALSEKINKLEKLLMEDRKIASNQLKELSTLFEF